MLRGRSAMDSSTICRLFKRHESDSFSSDTNCDKLLSPTSVNSGPSIGSPPIFNDVRLVGRWARHASVIGVVELRATLRWHFVMFRERCWQYSSLQQNKPMSTESWMRLEKRGMFTRRPKPVEEPPMLSDFNEGGR